MKPKRENVSHLNSNLKASQTVFELFNNLQIFVLHCTSVYSWFGTSTY